MQFSPPPRPPPPRGDGAAHGLIVFGTTVAWMVYRPLLSAPCRYLVPPHTRDAFFQAFCDLRTNTPKDGAWWARHARALAPRTALGWVAATAAALATASAGAALAAAALAVTALALYACLLLLAGGGLVAASAAGVTALALAFGSALAAAGAAAAGAAYGTGTVVTAGAAGVLGALLPGRDGERARAAAARARALPAAALSPVAAIGDGPVLLTAEDEFFKELVDVAMAASDGATRSSASDATDAADVADGLASPAAAPSTPAGSGGGSGGGGSGGATPSLPFGEGRPSSPAELSPAVDVRAAAARIEERAAGGGGPYRPSPLAAFS